MGHTEETKEKIRQANLNRKLSSETRAKMSAAQKGKKKPEGFNVGRKVTWRDKISESNRGKKRTEEVRKQMSESRKGKPAHNKGISWGKHTEEAKEKIRQAARNQDHFHLKNKTLSEETRKKLSESRKGRKHSEETKEKIRQANLGKKRTDMCGENNPMHTHPNSYKSKYGKAGYRSDLNLFLRSAWEANILRIFRFLNFSVEYEPESFVLSDGTTYRPDFFIHETGELVEVKGRWIKDARRRYNRFKKEYPGLPIEVIGKYEYNRYINEFKDKVQNLEV